jgi:tetratricopeptide (TPR) repeat protein
VKKPPGALLIAIVTGWIYFPCLNGTWLWDDGLEVSENPILKAAGGWWTPWIRPEGMDYFPLKSTLQWVEWHVWGANPLGYHLANLGLHILSALLVWRLLRLLGVRAAFIGGLIFAVHPVAVESVAWISEFKNTVSLPPLLLAAIAYVNFDRDGRRGSWVASLAWFIAALACKTSVVMFPLVVLLHGWWRRGTLGRRDWVSVLPFFAAAFAMGAATVWFQSTRSIGIAGIPVGPGTRLAEAGWSIASYVRMCVWPVGMAPVYPNVPVSWTAALPWLGILAILGVFWVRRAGWGRHALLGSGWFLLNLVPVLGLVSMAYFRVSARADHFAYVSLVGMAGLAAAAFGAALGACEKRAVRRRVVRLIFALGCAAAACAMAVEAHAYSGVFHDGKALWMYAVGQSPSAWLARSNLGKALYEEGRPAEAARQFREAIALEPDSPEAHADLGNCLEAQGDSEGARREYTAALAINPRFAGAHYTLGLAFLRERRLDEAAEQFRATLGIDPAHSGAANNLGLVFAARGNLPEAMNQYRRALALNPAMPEVHLNMGNVFFRLGRLDEAIAEYRETLRLYPGYSGAHQNLGQALKAMGRDAEAQAEFSEARRTANH